MCPDCAQKSQVIKRLYTLKEAAFFLGRTEWSIRELIYKGEIPFVQVGRRVHCDIRDLERFIDEHKVT